jgi:uncharacterized protein DUF4154
MASTVSGPTQSSGLALRVNTVLAATLPALLLVFLPAFGAAEISRQDLSQLKAVYLLNLAKLIEWPAGLSKDRWTLCVLGNDPFGSSLEQTLAGKTVQGRNLAIYRSQHLQDLGHCQILFISPSEKNQLPAILGALKSSNILTVGEIDSFANLGGGINFFMDDNRLRLEINKSATDRAGLKLSSKVLKLAKVVTGASGQ